MCGARHFGTVFFYSVRTSLRDPAIRRTAALAGFHTAIAVRKYGHSILNKNICVFVFNLTFLLTIGKPSSIDGGVVCSFYLIIINFFFFYHTYMTYS